MPDLLTPCKRCASGYKRVPTEKSYSNVSTSWMRRASNGAASCSTPACRNQTISFGESKRSIRRRWGRTTGILQPRRNQSPCGLCLRTQYHDCPRNRHARTCRSRTSLLPGIGVLQPPCRNSQTRLYSKHFLCRERKYIAIPQKRIRRNMHLVPLVLHPSGRR